MAVPEAALSLMSLFWGVFLVVWWLASKGASPAVETEGPSRYVHFALFVGAFALVALPIFSTGHLATRVLPASRPLALAGLAVEAAGFAFAFLARRHLGEHWSGQVTVKEGHQLIRTGPYALARHPIYTGLLFAVLGSALVVGEARGIVALVLLLLAYAIKIPREERVLAAHFGEEYQAYRREVKALIPYLL